MAPCIKLPLTEEILFANSKVRKKKVAFIFSTDSWLGFRYCQESGLCNGCQTIITSYEQFIFCFI